MRTSETLVFLLPLYYLVFNWLASIVACGGKREENYKKGGPVAMATENI